MTTLATDALGVVTLLNRIVVTGVLVTAFALIIYIGLYNRGSQIARNFAIMLACVIGALLGDLLAQISTADSNPWLRFQWVGIAFIPAASLALSDTLLRATGNTEPYRRLAPRIGYLIGAVSLGLVLFTDLLASPSIGSNGLPRLQPGPLFGPFTLFYFPSLVWATYNVFEARRRALTSTTRRRMTYFAIAFAAPALSMFPYLLWTGWPSFATLLIPWIAVLLVNMGLGAAITFMGYTMAYFGASAPDRVIKRRMVKYLIRGPLLAAVVIMALVLSTRVERWFDLPGFFVGLIAAATIILLTQLFIVTLQPTIDRLIAGDDSAEVKRLQQFSERLMTTSDQTQYLENILAALCDLMRARTAFVASADGALGHSNARAEPLNVVIGHVDPENESTLPVTPEALRSVLGDEPPVAPLEDDDVQTPRFIRWDGYWLVPLHAAESSDVLGVMGLAARTSQIELTEDERTGVNVLIGQAARALEDALKQRRAFEALERLVPDADAMQRTMAQTANPAAPTISDFSRLPDSSYDDLTRLVQDAFKDFWGGPRLTESPLMQLQIVVDAMKAENGNASKALRRVLSEAIEKLKPDGQRSFTAAEWVLYNILELKVLQSQKVRDVARKLVMSESDLFRKQKAAFAEIARIVAEMERDAREARGRADGA
jgi:hypothetical protein